MPAGDLYLLDTNILLAYVRGGALGQRIETQYRLRASSERPLVSVVSVGEIRALALKFGHGEAKLRALDEILEETVVVDINVEAIVNAYARIDHYVEKVIHNPWGRMTYGSRRRYTYWEYRW